jgi:penicillin amidase
VLPKPQTSDALIRLLALDRALPPPPSTSASNAWAITGARTKLGKPIIAGDPHLRLRAPNLWYLARITAPGLTLTGATLPGVPFHVLGHNGTVGWTMTTTGADTEDLVIEKIDPADPSRYLTPDGSRPFSTVLETIAVKGGDAVKHKIRSTINGPVLSDIDGRGGRLSDIAPAKTVIALRASLLTPDDRTAEALYHLNRARNWRSFRDALRLFHSPVQNFIYGDTAGHIGFQLAGRIPIRENGIGYTPVLGDQAGNKWRGFIPFDDLPKAIDPKSGTIVNANNRVVGSGYRHFIARDWDRPYRAQRIVNQLDANPKHDLATSSALQMDNISLAARDLLPGLLSIVAKTEESRSALGLLRAWDGTVTRDRAEPLIFHAWLREAVKAIAADELGSLISSYRRVDPLFIRHVLEKDQRWCDDQGTAGKESCGMALAKALNIALRTLRRRFGNDIKSWTWGQAHIATFRNRALERVPLIGGYANISIATDGDNFTPNRGTSRITSNRAPFAHVHGATVRTIYDFSDLNRSLFIHPTGQSGNPLSPHYRDLIKAWRDGRYVTIPDTARGVSRRLRLLPAGQ